MHSKFLGLENPKLIDPFLNMKVTVLFPALHDHSQKLRFTRIITLQPKSTTRVEQELDDQSSKKIERHVEVGKRKTSTFEEVYGSKKKMTMKKPPTAAQRKLKRLREEARTEKRYLDNCKLMSRITAAY